jgi:hypothetical protein
MKTRELLIIGCGLLRHGWGLVGGVALTAMSSCQSRVAPPVRSTRALFEKHTCNEDASQSPNDDSAGQ